jgi:hypothetical protein
VSVSAEVDQRRRIRNGAIGIALVALAFYVGFIALTIYRSSH